MCTAPESCAAQNYAPGQESRREEVNPVQKHAAKNVGEERMMEENWDNNGRRNGEYWKKEKRNENEMKWMMFEQR